MNILEQLRNTARAYPDRIAMCSEDGSISYGALDTASTRLAYTIQNICGTDKTPVPVYGHKSTDMLVSFLACVKSGRGYCPIDISVPSARIRSIIETVHAPLLLTCEPLPQEAEPDFMTTILNSQDIRSITVASDPLCEKEILHPVKNEEIFYMIFTSGSTGTPKGVQITADCLNHYLDWSVGLGNSYVEKEGKVFLNQAPFSFDLSVMDLYTCLACGGTLFTLSKKTQENFSALLSALQTSHASVWVSTPSFADICLSDPAFCRNLLPELDVFLFCGETLTNSTVSKLHERFPDTIVMNTYGPTESTVAVTEVLITPERNRLDVPLPVGKAKPGTILEIHDQNGLPLPEGSRGEIVIIGNTVSTGYYRQKELTEKAFFKVLRNGQSMRAYRTGDEGYIKNGQLYYCGRIDLQIKLHGYRIELEDIETNLLKIPGVESAVAVPNVRDGKVKSITAFIVCTPLPEDRFFASQDIKKQLKEFVPDYMVPKKIVFLDHIPMTPNGKADRKKLGGL